MNFLVLPKENLTISYKQLLHDVGTVKIIPKILSPNDLYIFFLQLISSIYYEKEVVLIDAEIKEDEVNRFIEKLCINKNDFSYVINKESMVNIHNTDEVMINSHDNRWKLSLFTSGTTGQPKAVQHNMQSFLRTVKIGKKYQDKTWALAYNPSHMAGLQVFFQAVINQNTIVDIFSLNRALISKSLLNNKVTNISATPTYYRSILPYLSTTYPFIETVTMGGEKYDQVLEKELKKKFPNAKFYNIYASTEAGSILKANGTNFTIPTEHKSLVKIDQNELLIHESLLGFSSDLKTDKEGWFHTGDLVCKNNDESFSFVSRSNELINVGGYKLNPHDVEEIIRNHDDVEEVIVYSRANRIVGNLVVADIVLKKEVNPNEFEKKLRIGLEGCLQSWKIPRIFYFVDSIELTRTGKKKRI